jgi:hypothetical protein
VSLVFFLTLLLFWSPCSSFFSQSILIKLLFSSNQWFLCLSFHCYCFHSSSIIPEQFHLRHLLSLCFSFLFESHFSVTMMSFLFIRIILQVCPSWRGLVCFFLTKEMMNEKRSHLIWLWIVAKVFLSL